MIPSLPKPRGRLRVDVWETWLRTCGFEDHHSRPDEMLGPTCPICGDGRDHRLMVNKLNGKAVCIACTTGWQDAWRFYVDWTGASRDEATQVLYGFELVVDELEDPEEERESGTPILALTVPPELQGCAWLPDAPQPWMEEAIAAAAQRGFDRAWLQNKGVGFGLLGLFAYRLVVPSFWHGVLAYGQGWDWSRRSGLKYLSTVERSGHIGRDGVFYQLQMYEQATVFVVLEGYFNVWTVEQAGYAAGCPTGKVLSDAHMEQLRTHPVPRTYVFAQDPDARLETLQYAIVLERSHHTVLIVDYLDNRDMNDLGPAAAGALVAAARAGDWRTELSVLEASQLKAAAPLYVSPKPRRGPKQFRPRSVLRGADSRGPTGPPL
ncbi:MAG: hypothetical protein V3W44_03595 [Dehalococcoidales bacterium]